MSFTVGADPEVFVRDNQSQLVSAYNMIPGTKLHPHTVPEGAVQVDGMALEYNIDPANTEDEFAHRIEAVLETLSSMIPDDYGVDVSPVALFPEQYLSEQPAKARMLGCDPDYNAYTGLQNEMPAAHSSMRTAAGHVHIGWTDYQNIDSSAVFQSCCKIVRQLDFTLGLLGTIFDPDTHRKEMYGKPGAFRPKVYGVEYRVLSNFWIKDPHLTRLVYRHAKAGFDRLRAGQDLYQEYGETAVSIINDQNVNDAYRMLAAVGLDVS